VETVLIDGRGIQFSAVEEGRFPRATRGAMTNACVHSLSLNCAEMEGMYVRWVTKEAVTTQVLPVTYAEVRPPNVCG
jgi:hypothetical protein